MREIKFRAWDDVREKMYFWDGTGLGQAMPHWISKNTQIMQFTGLKDKNGKEIFEGDIVKTDNYNGIHYFIVEFEQDYCGSLSSFVFRCIDGEFSSVHCEATDICKVIGNKFENSELLEKVK